MTRSKDIRLRNGLGWVNRLDGASRDPPDGESFGLAAGADASSVLFYAVDTASHSRGVAVLAHDGNQPSLAEVEEAVVLGLLRAGYAVVAWVGPEAPRAAVVRCYGDGEDATEHAACAVWALKTIGGWDESERMTFCVTHIGFADRDRRRVEADAWLSVRGEHGSPGWAVDVARIRPSGP